MIKDVFVLKRKSFWTWMMKYIWDIHYSEFSHMCPFFWLSILNILIIPFVLFVKTIFQGISLIALPLFAYLEEVLPTPSNRKRALNAKTTTIELNPEELEKFTLRIIHCHVLHKDSLTKEESKIYTNLSWDVYRKIQVRLSEERLKNTDHIQMLAAAAKAKADLEWKKTIAAKERINKLLRIASPIGKGLLLLLAASSLVIALYGIYVMIRTVVVYGTFEWLLYLIFVLMGIAGIISAFAFVFTLYTIIGNYVSNIERNIFEIIGDSKVFKGITFVFRKIWNFLCFIKQMIAQECPAVKFQ